LTQKL